MKILIGADIVPTSTNEELFIDGNMERLLGTDLLQLLKSSDFNIFNLEVPLTNKVTPIEKYGPTLCARIETKNGMKAMGIDFFTLGNNHILDQGYSGLDSTIQQLKDVGIFYAGAGKDIVEAAKPYVYVNEGKRIGIYCCSDYEFSIATESTPGANPFDPLESLDHISALKEICDYVFVLYHGGKELYQYPSPLLQKRCRKMVDKGADLVVCQHSHCIGSQEKWKNGTIVYGQGNFLFDNNKHELWKTGLLISWEDGDVSYIPIVKDKEKVRLAQNEQAKKILYDFYERSKKTLNIEFINDSFKNYSDKMLDGYVWHISGASNLLFYRLLNKITQYRFCEWFSKKLLTKQQILKLINYFECEAHNELIAKGLRSRRK